MATKMQAAQQATPPEEHLEEPADYDSWYSALVSFVFHFCLVMLIPLLAQAFTPAERLPPAIEVVNVVDSVAATGSLTDDLPADTGPVEMTQEAVDTSQFEPVNEPIKANQIEQTVSTEELLSTEDILEQGNQAAQRSQQAAASARAAADRILQENLGGGGGGTGGEGGGRAGRYARWRLTFESRDAAGYLRQIGGLGGEVAFPANGGKYLYFTNLSSSPKGVERSLNNENRMYWHADPELAQTVASHLGVRSSGGVMIVFLPPELEQDMLDMELRYSGKPVTEDDIESTYYVCIVSGGNYSVRVVSQELR